MDIIELFVGILLTYTPILPIPGLNQRSVVIWVVFSTLITGVAYLKYYNITLKITGG